MEPKRKHRQYDNSRTSYVEGSAVRKLNNMPDTRREEQYYDFPSPRRQEHRRVKTLSGINFTSLLVLSAAIIATLYVCMDYLKINSEVTQMNRQVIENQQELTKLMKDNDAALETVNEAVDLDQIYHYAVEELGMVYPNKNTVIKYHSNDDDYVIKYQEIPD